MTKLHPTAIVEDGASLGADVEIGPYCHVGRSVRLGDGVRLLSHAVVSGNTEIGAGSIVHPFASLGSPPQHARHQDDTTQLIIGKNTVVREHVTMNPGTEFGHRKTVVGDNNMFMTASHVGHDCIVGSGVTFANNATLAGHVEVGDNVFLGGLCAIHQFSRVGRGAIVGGMSGLEGDLIPFGSAIGARARLAGLNIIGMKRSDMPRETIHKIRRAYRQLFEAEGTFDQRVDQLATDMGDCSEVMEIVDFVRTASKRPLCHPRGASRAAV